MKNTFNKGDVKEYSVEILPADVAAFHGKVVHEVCSTFALTREVEWTTRQFVLEMIEEDEEGVGTFVLLNHKGPAFVGERVVIRGIVEEMNGHELVCTFEARVGERLVAEGKTGQKIFKKEKLAQLFNGIKKKIDGEG